MSLFIKAFSMAILRFPIVNSTYNPVNYWNNYVNRKALSSIGNINTITFLLHLTHQRV
jgi:hypothetical protein